MAYLGTGSTFERVSTKKCIQTCIFKYIFENAFKLKLYFKKCIFNMYFELHFKCAF